MTQLLLQVYGDLYLQLQQRVMSEFWKGVSCDLSGNQKDEIVICANVHSESALTGTLQGRYELERQF